MNDDILIFLSIPPPPPFQLSLSDSPSNYNNLLHDGNLTSANYELNKKSFKDHEKEVVKDIINAKRLYYTRIFNVYRSDIKKTWKTMNETLSKNKQILELPSSFFHNGKELTNPSEIASEFNKHFANIGKTVASEIASNTTNNSDYTQYLKTPSLKTCTFKCVTQEDIVKAIDNLENKNSSGHDGISNKVLKYIKLELSNSLTLIVNQMLTTGIFPDSFKKSKITPIFKKGDSSLLINYRPISLLPTISKILSWKNHTKMVANKISRVIGILFRLKNIFPKEILLTLYNTLIYSYINYGLLVWGIESSRIEALQKKAIRLVTNSAYIAHTTPLFIEEGLLKVQDIFKLKLLKFYYKLSNNLLPPYFESYLDVINREPPRALRQHFIHQPMIKRSYAECTPLFQLIKLINAMRRDPTDTILEIIAQNNQSYCQLSYNIKKIYLDTYDPICRIRNCFVCKL